MKTGVMSFGIGLVAAVLAAGSAAAQAKKWDTVKIATEGAYAPWNFTGAGGKLEGFEIDLANELCTRMKAKCEIVAQDWDGIIPALTAKKYDAIMAGMNGTDERRKVIDFSRPYAVEPNGYMVAKTSPLAKMPGTGKVYDLAKQSADAEKAINEVKPLLKGKTIGVQVSTTHANFAEKYLKGTADIREYKTTEQHDLDLAAGRIDAVLANQSALVATLDKPEFKDFTIVGPGLTGGVLGGGVSVGLRKDEADLKTMFDNAIASATADGTIKKLSEKWFKINITPQS
jgi:octopine/nopaline transport system substrate-binding protein